jgi:hypothetical protein
MSRDTLADWLLAIVIGVALAAVPVYGDSLLTRF